MLVMPQPIKQDKTCTSCNLEFISILDYNVFRKKLLCKSCFTKKQAIYKKGKK